MNDVEKRQLGDPMRGISITLDSTLEVVEQTVREALAEEGFGILTEIDIAKTFLAKLGIERPPLKILGACNPNFAYQAISHDPSTALLLPCNVVIEATETGVTVTAADPRELLHDAGLAGLVDQAAQSIERALRAVSTRLEHDDGNSGSPTS